MITHARTPFGRSYWVVPDKFLAGAYPGSTDQEEALAKITGLVECGIRSVVNLMEEDERNFSGEQFEPYEHILAHAASVLGVEISLKRMPVRDLQVPSRHEMVEILNTIDRAIENGQPVYVHCWGVGRRWTNRYCGGLLPNSTRIGHRNRRFGTNRCPSEKRRHSPPTVTGDLGSAGNGAILVFVAVSFRFTHIPFK
jgi:hypothetical protein